LFGSAASCLQAPYSAYDAAAILDARQTTITTAI